MRRCLELAALGAGHVAPNPMVGAVLVHGDRIIGEGYHMLYGAAHAEVNCIDSVRPEDVSLIAESTMYVSLEPCAHFGKTPPCADMLVRMKVPRVVVGCRDPFPAVNGKGIDKLLAAGIDVTVGVLEQECIWLNRRFFTFNTQHRPYIVLKWAQSADRKIAAKGMRTRISNDYTNRLVHRWRSEEAAILVGTRTARVDDPALTVRLWSGPDPVRMVVDKELKLPSGLRLFDGSVKTVVFNMLRHEEGDDLFYYQLSSDSSIVHQIVMAGYQLKLQSILVEGGARLLQSFIDEGYWDEARVITNNELQLPGGLPAPELIDAGLTAEEKLVADTIHYYRNMKGNS